ncbi:MAG: SPOR domain-containing protein [Methylococcales bacterium]|nr:SPOR domain-containing protein [Methylococcales bacterium]
MTDSTNEKPTARQNRRGLQDENFDFELADINTTPESADSLFTEAQQENAAPNSDIASAAAPLIPSTPVTSEIKTNFYVDYFDQCNQRNQRKKNKTTEQVSVAQINQPTVDDRSQDAMIPENPVTPTEQTSAEDFYSEPLDEQPPFIDGAGMAIAVLSQFKSKQERINRQQEDLIYEVSEKIKSTSTITNTAIFFGIVALAAATTLGFMLSKTNTEVSNLTGTTTAIKDEIRNTVKASSSNNLEGTDPALDQLKQKVDDVIAQLNEVTAHQNKENTAVTKPIATKPLVENTPPDVAVVEIKPAVESIVKATPVVNTVKSPITEKSVAVVDVPTTKPESKVANKTVKTITTKQAVAPTTKPETNSKTANKGSVIPDKAVQALPANDINNVINNARLPTVNAPVVATTSTNTAPQVSTGGWTVNLASSNKMEDAKKTAARFTQQGVPVTISPYKVTNETRYRLQVKGFKSKDEATAYGTKAKAALKLNSVWINP